MSFASSTETSSIFISYEEKSAQFLNATCISLFTVVSPVTIINASE